MPIHSWFPWLFVPCLRLAGGADPRHRPPIPRHVSGTSRPARRATPSHATRCWPSAAQAGRRAVWLVLVSGLMTVLPARADELTGIWSGTLTQGGESSLVSMTFSKAGYFVLTYTNNQGVTRSSELIRPGQKVEYVPSGGGVRSHVVDAVAKQPGRLSMVLRTSFERASGGYLTQNYSTESLEFRLTPVGLDTRITSRSERYFGDSDGSMGGNGQEVATGVLRRHGNKTSGSKPSRGSGGNELARLRQEMDALSEQQRQLSKLLEEKDRQAKEAIERIKSAP